MLKGLDAKERGVGTLGATGKNLREKRKGVAKTTNSLFNYSPGEKSDKKPHFLFYHKRAEILVNGDRE